MPHALLTIEADASSFRSALAEARGVARRAVTALNADARAGARERGRIEAEEIAQARRDLRSMTQARQRAARDRQRAEEAAARASKKASDTAVREAAKAEAKRTNDARRESKARSVLAAREAKDVAKAEARKVVETERAEKRRTVLAEQEARKRARAEARAAAEAERQARQARGRRRAFGRQVGSVVREVGGAAAGYVGHVHGEVQGARERRASTERTLGTALFQAGADRPDVQAAMQRFTHFAADNGIESSELAEAANAAQTEFSVFGDRHTGAAERNTRIGSFLETSLLARNTGNDIGEFGRLEGLFQQQGFNPALRRQLLLFTAGAAQRGAVETGTITREAMPAITSRMGSAMAEARRNGTDPQAAAVAAYRQTLAELEVARGTEGESPRSAGNAINRISQRLQGNVTQDKLLDNIRNSLGRGSALESQLYEADPTRRGHQRLRSQYTNALNLVDAFGQQHLDAVQFMNITGGGGHGNPMSMLQNERRVLSGLLNADATGKTGAARIHELMGADTALTDADVARGARVFGGDAKSRLNKDSETHDNALTSNTSALVQLSNRFADWSARNPLLAPAAGAVSPLVMNGVSRGVGSLVGGVGAGAGGAGAAGAAGVGLGALALPAASAVVAGVMADGAMSAGQSWAARELQLDANRRAAGAAFGADQSVSGLPRLSLDDASVDRLAAAMRGATITASVSPHDAAQAASTAAGSRSVPPPP